MQTDARKQGLGMRQHNAQPMLPLIMKILKCILILPMLAKMSNVVSTLVVLRVTKMVVK